MADEARSYWEIYQTTGDSKGALKVLQSQNPTHSYNEWVLSLPTDLSNEPSADDSQIVLYNRSLLEFSQGNYQNCSELLWKQLGESIEAQKLPMNDLATQMAVLYVEALLLANTKTDYDRILTWLELWDSDDDVHIKFVMSVAKSRIRLHQKTPNSLRLAKKDLKTAMEVYHKLRGNSEGNSSVMSEEGSQQSNSQQQPPQPQGPLGKYSLTAFSLKSHLELCKGNLKKSIVLNQSKWQDNNLALVYASHDCPHLAWHVLQRQTYERQILDQDGTAQPDWTRIVLYNAGLTALACRLYLNAYQCLAACIEHHPKCILRMAQACIGWHDTIKRKQQEQQGPVTKVCRADRQLGLWWKVQSFLPMENLVADPLGSKSDMEQVERLPLLRGRACCEHVLTDSKDPEILSPARLGLCYILLECKDFVRALDLAQTVAKDGSASKSHVATARLYAAEAASMLGQDGLGLLQRDGNDKALDQLAMDLVYSSDSTTSTCLEKAQRQVRATASMVTKNMHAAKQLATSAQDEKALAYYHLRGGNEAAALKIIKAIL